MIGRIFYLKYEIYYIFYTHYAMSTIGLPV